MDDLYDDISFNLLVDVAKARYKEELGKVTSIPGFIEVGKLKRQHELAIHTSLKLISETRKLSDKQKQDVKLSLDSLFSEYENINSMKQASSAPAIGIDLGTTNCCLAVFRNNRKVEIIPSDVGKNSTPSYISFQYDDDNNNDDDDDEQNEHFSGQAAKDLAHDNLRGTIFDVKRMLGRQFNDPRIQKNMVFWPFDVIDDKGQLKVKIGPSYTLTPVELTTVLLQHLKRLADEYLNANVVSAVVAVPAYYNATQRRLTEEACRMAGLNVLQLVNEPTAAAVAYNIHKKQTDNEGSWNSLIFDFGGGTLDIAVLTFNSDKIHVKAVSGDAHLGGSDIDNNMVDYCVQQFKKQHGVDLQQERLSGDINDQIKSLKRLRRLKMECEKQKQFLSQTKTIVVSLDAMHGSTSLVVPITRQVFDTINFELYKKCIAIMAETLGKSGLDKDEIDEVVLVGGSCRIPRLQEMVSEFFDGKQLCRSVDADEAIAVGAAMLAFCAEHVEVPNVLIQETESSDMKGTFKASSLRGSFKHKQVTKRTDIRTFVRALPDTKEIPTPTALVKRDIGIYIDSNMFKIGSYQQTEFQRVESKGTFTELLSISPELYFSDGGILLGQEAHAYRQYSDSKYFNIFELLTFSGRVSLHRLSIHNIKYEFCTHEIVAIFIKKALNSVQVQEGGALVVTIPFIQKSLFVERIRKSAGILGHNDVRVLSSHLTLALGSTVESGRVPFITPDQCLFVLDIQRKSFSIGNVRISKDGIVNNEMRSENHLKFQEERFLNSYSSLYDGVDISQAERTHVVQAIEEVIDFFVPEAGTEDTTIHELVLRMPVPVLVMELFKEILSTKVFALKLQTYGNSILGASLLAASKAGSVSNIMGLYSKVVDYRYYLITLTTDFGGPDRSEEFLENDKKVFDISLDRIKNGPKTYHVQLNQQFCEGGHVYGICRYHLTIAKRTGAKQNFLSLFRRSIPIKIWREADTDDMYELKAEIKSKIPVVLTMERQDTTSCNSGCENSALPRHKNVIQICDLSHM